MSDEGTKIHKDLEEKINQLEQVDQIVAKTSIEITENPHQENDKPLTQKEWDFLSLMNLRRKLFNQKRNTWLQKNKKVKKAKKIARFHRNLNRKK